MLRRSQRLIKSVTSSQPPRTRRADDVTKNYQAADDVSREDSDVDEFEVDKVLDCAVDRNGGKFYYVTFVGWHRGENQWIAAEDMSCDDKIREFERNEAKIKREREDPPEPNRLRLQPPSDPLQAEEEARRNVGWEGSEVDHVIGAAAHLDAVYYLVKWTNGRIQSLRSDQLTPAFPQKLITYFESILEWG